MSVSLPTRSRTGMAAKACSRRTAVAGSMAAMVASASGSTFVQSGLRLREENVSVAGAGLWFDDIKNGGARIRHAEVAGGNVAIVNPTVDLLELRDRHGGAGYADRRPELRRAAVEGIDVVPLIVSAKGRRPHPLGRVEIGRHAHGNQMGSAVGGK